MPASLLRRGLRRTDLPPGTKIKVEGYQAKDGGMRANGRNITLPDGRALFLGAGDQSLYGHDLQEFERARVTDVFLPGEHFVNFPDRGRPARPEDLEDGEFRGSGVASGVLFHGAEATTKNFVLSTKLFVVNKSAALGLSPGVI